MEEAFGGEDSTSEQAKRNTATPSKKKASRIMLLGMVFQVSAPGRLSWQDIQKMLPSFYGENPRKAIYRDIATLAGTVVEQLPKPDDPSLAEWCAEQQRCDLLAITYDRQARTFGLAQSILSVEINEDSELGYFVYLPFGENHRSDMIVEDDDGNLHRIQCKTGRIENGCVVFNACSNNSYHHNGGRRDYRGRIDYFAVYVPDTKKTYMIHVDHASKTECKLRLEPTKNNQEKHVKWAKDYEA